MFYCYADQQLDIEKEEGRVAGWVSRRRDEGLVRGGDGGSSYSSCYG